MRRMPAGQWLAFEGYDTIHNCSHSSTTHTYQSHQSQTFQRPSSSQSRPTGYDDLEIPNVNVGGDIPDAGSDKRFSPKPKSRWFSDKNRAASRSYSSDKQASSKNETSLPNASTTAKQAQNATSQPSSGGHIPINSENAKNSSKTIVAFSTILVIGAISYYLISVKTLPSSRSSASVEMVSPLPQETSSQPSEQRSDEIQKLIQEGMAYAKAERYEEAVNSYRRTIALNPNADVAYQGMGYALNKLSRYEEALEAFRKAIELYPGNVEAHRNLGEAYAHLGDWAAAAQSLKQAIKLKPDYIPAFLDLGSAYQNLHQYKAATEVYQKVIRAEPNLDTAYYELGKSYLGLSNRDKALNQHKILLSLNRNLAEQLYIEIVGSLIFEVKPPKMGPQL
jgi:tetratricopeptide (TPR) repeat protein